MTFKSKMRTAAPQSSYQAILAIVVAMIVASAAVGGFLLGRQSRQDAYINKVRDLLAIEGNGLSLYQALGPEIEDPLTQRAMANLYQVPVGDRPALAKRLQGVAFVPPYRPAPFVGHIARPLLGEEPHINMLGFRDERDTYISKGEKTVRVFITGGSVAWGTGAPSQKETISYLLERLLHERMGGVSGYRYEVVNAAHIAWSTTQEKLLIQQRLVELHPDVVIMLSGNNDLHWQQAGMNIRWFYTHADLNYLTLLNEAYKSDGHPERASAAPVSSRPLDCRALGRIAKGNVEDAAVALNRVGAQLVFALQPNIVSTAKHLSQRERKLLAMLDKPRWEACYQTLREELGGINARNYRFLDLSRAFGEADQDTEVFLDSYHVAGLGNGLIARALAERVDWPSIEPSPATEPEGSEPLRVVDVGVTKAGVGTFFKSLFDGRISIVRLVPNRINKNLVVVLDQSVLPTTVAADAIVAAIPATYPRLPEHKIRVADWMTGETSPAVALLLE
jgi:hypothetical protein